jgi:hypothetical protein
MQRSSIFDGPLQRQMLLLKLSHELSNRPYFGTTYAPSADSLVQVWISRVRAIMTRIGGMRSIEFDAARTNLFRSWEHSINLMLRATNDALEDLKLELDLYQEDQIGKVYDANSEYQFISDLIEIVGGADSDLLIVDPYFDAATFTMLFPIAVAVPIRILMTKRAEGVKEVAARYYAETGVTTEVRTSKDIHDRLLLINRRDCWLVGGSLKDGGRKPSYIMPIQPDLAQAKIGIYEPIWEDAQQHIPST